MVDVEDGALTFVRKPGEARDHEAGEPRVEA
jgi:hypothetical protein